MTTRNPIVNPRPGDVVVYQSYLRVFPSDRFDYQLVTLIVSEIENNMVIFKTITTENIANSKIEIVSWCQCLETLKAQVVYISKS